MRIRHYLQTPKILQEVLRTVVDEIKKKLITRSPNASTPQIGAVSFIQNFGNSLNIHPNFHIIVADGVFCGDKMDLKFYEAWDREGLERLIRYCARPPFASENLRMHGSLLVYRFPKPSHTGKTYIQLTPLDFIEKIVALIQPPHPHRRHYHGVYAPNSPLRKKVAANAKARPEAFTLGVQERRMVFLKIFGRLNVIPDPILHGGDLRSTALGRQ